MPSCTSYLRVAVATTAETSTNLDVAAAVSLDVTTALSVISSDAVRVVLEPDAPKATAAVTLTDLYLNVQANGISSPTTDFQAAGVQAGSVLEIYEGQNRGNYIVTSIVEPNFLLVAEAFPYPTDSGPLAGEVRNEQTVVAVSTAALVLDQPLWIGAVTRSCSLAVVID